MAASDGELKVFEALRRTWKKSPGQRRRGTGPRTSQNTTSKCPGLVPRVGAEDFLVSESTKGLVVELFSTPFPLQDEGGGGGGGGEPGREGMEVQVC